MKVFNEEFFSSCSPEVTTQILRAIDDLACQYRDFLPQGWQVIVEMFCEEENSLYYHLRVQSNSGGGEQVKLRQTSGAARVPYDILVTKFADEEELSRHPKQLISNTKGYVEIAFDGASHVDLNGFFEFAIFQKVQSILEDSWTCDQIWWNLRDFWNTLQKFWIKELGIEEVVRKK